MPSDLLTVDGVWKRYGERDVLRDLRFSLRAGESVGYLGPNGAGKSTTFKLLTGVSRPSRGSVRVHGFDPGRDRARALRRLGTLVESPGVAPFLTGDDLLDYVARVKGVSSLERAGAVRAAMEAVGVREHAQRPIGSLSTGLTRRMLLAAALVGDPEILLLDEPTLGLDPAARHDLRGLLRSLVKGGRTLLLSTHLLEDVEAVCDRVLFLRSGALVGDERVNVEAEPGSGRAGRTVRLTFASPVTEDSIAAAAGTGGELHAEGACDWSVHFRGADSEQAALLAAIVRAGLPLLAASAAEPELARRYLEIVGREEAP